MRDAYLAGVLCLSSAIACADPIDDFFQGEGNDFYRMAKMFAWCSAQYEASAVMFTDKDSPAMTQQLKDTARGARMAGAYGLYINRAQKVVDGTAKEDGVKRDL